MIVAGLPFKLPVEDFKISKYIYIYVFSWYRYIKNFPEEQA